MDDKDTPVLLPWTTPRLERLGTMDDVRSDAGGDDDGSGLPADPVMGS